jgi:hypothetical protein
MIGSIDPATLPSELSSTRKEAPSMPSPFIDESPEERPVAVAEPSCECPDACRIDHEND